MKRLAIAAIVVSLTGSVAAQTAGIPDSALPSIGYPSVFDIAGGGARARGMGNAYIATGNDATALTWNPAGIHDVDKTVMTFGFSGFMPRGQSFTGPATAQQSGSFSGPGSIVFVSPFRMKGHGFVGGFSYSRVSDEASIMAYNAAVIIDPDGPADLFQPTLYSSDLRNQYHAQMTPITLGIGTNLTEKIAAGLSINIMNGKGVGHWSQHSWADNWFVPEYGAQKVAYDLTADILDSSKFSGIAFDLGFKYEVPKGALGLVIKLPYKMRQTTNRTIDVTTRVNGLVRTNGTLIQYDDNNVAKISMPIMIGVGGAYKLNEKTTLELDVEVKPYSGQKIQIRDTLKLIPGAKDEEIFHTFDPEWRNVVVIRAGGERMLTTTSRMFPIVPLRAGFSYVPIPDPNRADAFLSSNGDVHGLPTSTASSISFSLGSGVHWTQVYLDVAYTFRSYNRTLGSIKSESRDHMIQATFTGYF